MYIYIIIYIYVYVNTIDSKVPPFQSCLLKPCAPVQEFCHSTPLLWSRIFPTVSKISREHGGQDSKCFFVVRFVPSTASLYNRINKSMWKGVFVMYSICKYRGGSANHKGFTAHQRKRSILPNSPKCEVLCDCNHSNSFSYEWTQIY